MGTNYFFLNIFIILSLSVCSKSDFLFSHSFHPHSLVQFNPARIQLHRLVLHFDDKHLHRVISKTSMGTTPFGSITGLKESFAISQPNSHVSIFVIIPVTLSFH